MVRDTYTLLGPVIAKSKPSDERARTRGSHWSERHRLLILLDAGKQSIRTLPGAMREPWLVAELAAILDIVRIWKRDIVWKTVEPSLADPSGFSHLIAMLAVAEHFRNSGHRVELVPTGPNASPDLRIQAVGGKQDWVNVECYLPRVLGGKPVNLSKADAFKITREAMKKAKRQLNDGTPGVLAICMYNQPRTNLEPLRQSVRARFEKTSRVDFGGVVLLSQNNLVSNQGENMIFNPIYHVEFIQNPAYFMSVEFTSEDPPEPTPSGPPVRPSLKGIMIESIVNDIVVLRRQLGDVEEAVVPADNNEGLEIPHRVEKLTIVKEPNQEEPVLTWINPNKASVFFEGQGNVDFVCGNCANLLAKRTWKPSCSKINLLCPVCKLYNAFPDTYPLIASKTQNIGLEPFTYPFDNTVFVKRGVCLFGVERGAHLLRKVKT